MKRETAELPSLRNAMTVTINGIEIDASAIAAEAVHHRHAPAPDEAATYALAIRELLLQRAGELGLLSPDCPDDAERAERAIEAALDAEAAVPEPTPQECLRFFESHRDRFVVGELVEAAHILFGVTPNAPVDAIRHQAEATLKQLLEQPEGFTDAAKRFSNCPSGAQGGSLGQVQRGQLVPEFEKALFTNSSTGVLPRIVNSRYGFHIVFVARRIPGKALDFDTAHPRIASMLSARAKAKAAEQYVRMLASRATISGIDLAAAESPLLH
jgi:peptidyl-prolyl cis-trans isomerase C